MSLAQLMMAAALCVGAGAVTPVSEDMLPLMEADCVERDAQYVAAMAAAGTDAPVATWEDAAGGCDGVKNGSYGFHTASAEQDPWWQVDLGDVHELDRVVVFNRTLDVSPERTRLLRVLVSESGLTFDVVYAHDGEPFLGVKEDKPLVVSLRDKGVSARFVRLDVPGRCSFALDEVEVYPVSDPGANIALGRPADQKSVGPYSTRKSPGGEMTVLPFSLEHTREVVKRGARLAERLRTRADPESIDALASRMADLERELDELEAGDPPTEEHRRALYMEARYSARDVAFCNPLLDIDAILFVKRHDAKGVYHMVDQYYGFNAVHGGGLFILEDPFGPDPRLRNVLEHSVVENGRLAGRPLTPGAFLSPELSFDGSTILFAYTEGNGEDLEWTPESCFHIFRVNVDGTGLRQLTDGPWNDFDPCFLPNGRIAFISERRGGYLRCGRHCPTYTLYAMEPDGGDIIWLSKHETHEWHPSVNHDGMIVYTRWDYVDRDTNVAHHIWTCFPDGRDPRSFHGNYPESRESRPWMEMRIRAVPDSHKYVAVAAAHHGHEFGSLVLIDPRIEDDGAMSQLERITPEVPFPESERNLRPIAECMVYGTPWPLGEDDFLCVYDPSTRNRGIYWIDRDGNRELVYRDPEISCISPIPLRPRPTPPVIPTQTTQAARDRAAAGGDGRDLDKATVAVMNVYTSDFEWPEGATIAALRVIQVLPKTTPPPNEPRIGVADQTNARAVLGTVPVESDGSAYFEAPPGKQLYFQALDDRGLAIQSMRSGTYLHPGEKLTCLGCHESKHNAGAMPVGVPLAMRRAPSILEPEPEGAHPFSYVRLVQPVLDRHCVECHQREEALDLGGAIEGPHGWSRSYTNLAGKYGFYFHVSNGSINKGIHGGSRTIAGQFGARVAPLLEYLDDRHYGVSLTDEEFRRVTLWLDCNSEFYGAYDDIEAQSRGEVVWPSLE